MTFWDFTALCLIVWCVVKFMPHWLKFTDKKQHHNDTDKGAEG